MQVGVVSEGGPTADALEPQSRDEASLSRTGVCPVCEIRARQVDELTATCLKQTIEIQQEKWTLCQTERALQDRNTYVICTYEELVGRLTTELCELKQENRMLRERTNQCQLPFQRSQQTTATCLEETNRIKDQVARLTIEVTQKTEQRDRELETNAVLCQEVTNLTDQVARLTTEVTEKMETNAILSQEQNRLKDQITKTGEEIQQWHDNVATLTTEKKELMLEVRDLSDKKEAVAVLTKQVDELTEANKGLMKDKELQEDSLAVLESQKAELESQVERLQSVVTDMTHDLDKVTKENANAEKSLEEANEVKETEKQQADEAIHQLRVKLARDKDKIKSLATQVEELSEKREEERKRFGYEVSLEKRSANTLREEKAELARKLQIKEQEEEQAREDPVRAMAQRKSPSLEHQSLPAAVDPDSGVQPSSQPD